MTVAFELSGDVAILRFDDGKANVLSPAALAALRDALARAEKEAGAALLVGRDGRFSAGFDLSVFQEGGPAAARAMVSAGAELAVALARHPAPVVLGCTGHALAMGAVLLLAADLRVGAAGDFKIGFNEVALGMAPPLFLVELARERLSRRHLQRAVVQAEIYTPEAAADAGFLDLVVPAEELASRALEQAQRLAALPRAAFARARRVLRRDTLERIEASLAEDLAGAFPG